MQKEAFYEESAFSTNSVSEQKLYRACQIVGGFFLAVAVILLFLTSVYITVQQVALNEGAIDKMTFIFAIVQWVAFIASSLAIFFFFFFYKRRFNASYDYSFVEDELRVSKVFNGRKRKQIKKIETDRLTKVGWVKKDSFKRISAGYTKKNIVYLTPNKLQPAEGKEFFYLMYSSSTEKKIYIIEARTEMLDYIVRAAGINKLERN